MMKDKSKNGKISFKILNSYGSRQNQTKIYFRACLFKRVSFLTDTQSQTGNCENAVWNGYILLEATGRGRQLAAWLRGAC